MKGIYFSHKIFQTNALGLGERERGRGRKGNCSIAWSFWRWCRFIFSGSTLLHGVRLL